MGCEIQNERYRIQSQNEHQRNVEAMQRLLQVQQAQRELQQGIDASNAFARALEASGRQKESSESSDMESSESSDNASVLRLNAGNCSESSNNNWAIYAICGAVGIMLVAILRNLF